MSKVQAMLAFRVAIDASTVLDEHRAVGFVGAEMQSSARPESTATSERSRRSREHRPLGALVRWARHRNVAGPRTWRPWWLLGFVEVVTFPLPRFAAGEVLFVPGIAASCGLPARPAMLVAL